MKKLIIKSLFLTSILSFAPVLNSCQDALDITQPGEMNDDVLFSSVSNLEGYLNGAVYASLDPATSFYTSAILSDELKIGAKNGGQERTLFQHYIDGSDANIRSIWLSNYSIINRVNRLLEGAKNIVPSTSEVDKYNNILAQARTIRAYAYLELEKYFAPNMEDEAGLGVMITPDVPKTTDATPRSTNKEVYDYIESDLSYASSILKNGVDQYNADINLVNAIYARFNLYRGDLANAKKYANLVINNSGLELTKALPIQPEGKTYEIGSDDWNKLFYKTSASFNSYRKIWDDSDRGEVIFSLARQTSGVGSSIVSYFNTNSSSISGSPLWVWGRNIFNILDSTEGDIRRYAYVDPTSEIDPDYLNSDSYSETDQLIIDKYPGKTNASTRNDVKVFRLSEMYFILAEEAVSSNNLTEASSYIQKVREARNYKNLAKTPTYSSAEEAYADILKERRVELALEGHRYTDLKRLAAKAGVTMDRNITDVVSKEAPSNLENGSYKYTLPIPISEFSGNANMKQNPGY